MVIAYVAGKQVMFQSDLNPQIPGIYDTIVKLKLRPKQVVGGHGGVGTFADYAKAAAS